MTPSTSGGGSIPPPATTRRGTFEMPGDNGKNTPSLAALNINRTNVKAQIGLGMVLLLALCALWTFVALARAHELSNLENEQNRTPPAVVIGGHTATGATSTKQTNNSGVALELVLAGISTTLVLIGTGIRAFSTDIYQEAMDERVHEVTAAQKPIGRLNRRTALIKLAKNNVTTRLDLLPDVVYNSLQVAVADWHRKRFTRAIGRPLIEGVWRSTIERMKFAKNDPTFFFDGRMPAKKELTKTVADTRASVAKNRTENELLTFAENVADKHLKEITGVDPKTGEAVDEPGGPS